MPVLDLILIVVVLVFSAVGFWFGLVHAVGSLLGLVVGTYVAVRYYAPVAAWIMGFTGWEGNPVKLLVFVLAFILINRAVSYVFWFLERFINILLKFPFLRSFNRIFGLVLGGIEGLLTIGIVIYFIERVPLSNRIMEAIAASDMAAFARSVAGVLIPLFPDAFRLLKSGIDFAQGSII